MYRPDDFIIRDDRLTKYLGEGGEVTIPYGVSVVAGGAFASCEGLTRVIIPAHVNRVYDCAFLNCTSLEEVVIEGNAYVERGAFKGCTSLSSWVFGKGTTKIISIDGIPKSVKRITFSPTVHYFGNRAFYRTDAAFSEVHISDLAAWCGINFSQGENPLTVGGELYLNGQRVRELEIPEGTKEIEGYAFVNCSGLTSVVLPESTKRVGYRAFRDCTELESVAIKGGSRTFVASVFEGCDGIKSVEVADIGGWCSSEFISCESNPMRSGAALTSGGKTVTELVIPEGTEEIGKFSFCGCSSIQRVVVPKSVKKIGEMAFANCPALTSISIPDVLAVDISPDFISGSPNISYGSLADGTYKLCLFDKALCAPFDTLPDEVKSCYRFTEALSDASTVFPVGAFDRTSCTADEWEMLIDACNKWFLEINEREGLDTSDTELGYGGVSERVVHGNLYPADCLVRDGVVIGFVYNGHALLVGESKPLVIDMSCKGEHEDTYFVDKKTIYLRER